MQQLTTAHNAVPRATSELPVIQEFWNRYTPPAISDSSPKQPFAGTCRRWWISLMKWKTWKNQLGRRWTPMNAD